MAEKFQIQKVEVDGKTTFTITTEMDADSCRQHVNVSAWPVRVGATGGLNWKTFKAARHKPNSASVLRAHTK